MVKIKNLFLRNKHTIALTLFCLVLIFVTVYNPIKEAGKKEPYIYEEKFDMSKIPAGLVIWKHGVPETHEKFIHADSAQRYRQYDIGILSKDVETIYRVRVPYYAIGMFPLGSTVNINKKIKKNPDLRNLKPNYYVQPYNTEEKLKKLSNLYVFLKKTCIYERSNVYLHN